MANEINIGITGSSGFIGKSMIKFFKKEGITLLILKSRLNIIEEIKKEISELPKLDIIFHLAGTFYGDWESLYENNFIATKNLLSCLNSKITRVIFTSTGSVYGNSGEYGVNENCKCNPVDDYGRIKLMTEKLLCQYGNYIIFRLPSVYGNGNNKGVIYHWKNCISEGKKLMVGDNGLSVRSFLNVNDLVSIFLLSLKIKKSTTYNLSENGGYSMINLAKIITSGNEDNIEFFKSNNLLKSMVLKNDKFCSETNFIFSNLIDYINEN